MPNEQLTDPCCGDMKTAIMDKLILEPGGFQKQYSVFGYDDDGDQFFTNIRFCPFCGKELPILL